MLSVGTLFSGIGAPEQALKEMGVKHRVVFACDNDASTKKTYMANHGCDVFYDDITSISIKEIRPIDLLVFGFPCQPFSLAGHRGGMDDSRGRLVLKALDILSAAKPKFFVAENVHGLVMMEDGRILQSLLRRFRARGYRVRIRVLDSKEFGVPQQRRRVWIVGTRRDLQSNFEFYCSHTPMIPLADILDRRVDKRFFATRSFLAKDKVRSRMDTYDYPYVLCLTKTVARNGSSREYIGYVSAVNKAIGQKRKPTPRECLRLHGFPESFAFPADVSVTSRYEQAANTMTVPVLKSIFSTLELE